jgi:hypothetical protein
VGWCGSDARAGYAAAVVVLAAAFATAGQCTDLFAALAPDLGWRRALADAEQAGLLAAVAALVVRILVGLALARQLALVELVVVERVVERVVVGKLARQLVELVGLVVVVRIVELVGLVGLVARVVELLGIVVGWLAWLVGRRIVVGRWLVRVVVTRIVGRRLVGLGRRPATLTARACAGASSVS